MMQIFHTNEIHPSKLAEDIAMVHINQTGSFQELNGSNATGFCRIFSDFADKTSLNGVQFIKASSSLPVKVIWSLLLSAAIGAMIFHLYSMFTNYFAYTKHSQIDLSFSKLPFPAVTVCNVNIMRSSQKDKAGQALRDLINAINPQQMMEKAKDWKPTMDYSSGGDARRMDNFLDNFSMNMSFTNDRMEAQNTYFTETCKDCWEKESTSSSSNTVEYNFRELFNRESETTRDILGHQVQDLIQQCSFAGRKCMLTNFSRLHSTSYGNCYVIEYNKFISRKSGPDGGLELTLFLETDEYIPGITNGRGIQVVIHQPGTVPFPKDEGIAVAAGSQTFIGLRVVKVTRLGEPYSPCTSTDNFVTKYSKTYTRNTCQKICQEMSVRDKCHCYDESELELYDVIENPTGLKPCRNMSQLMCVSKVVFQYDGTDSSCECNNPCSETVYAKSIASRQWPSPSYADLLIQAICQEKPNSTCSVLKNKDNLNKLEDFIKLNIYFEDLNYEELSEQEDYTTTQLLSDIGGTIGLWIGLSVLSLFELVNLVTELIAYLFCIKLGNH
ncbi:amiloride-sensitive sodium channel subunit alpha-like isoform X2 [Biomphalaria glabrata]|uniref:Amiloride-sensitive sodium channel subunit alpha-like isoform X2 n=1 Tax=Biomphalaria glabrata TaxID=6526 RepID=A0A9W3AIK0_BIOGL|nr:amiloride-sensitive sodium channel subunit alpha-like isoform X2 [Biomphalaria glabrata]